jgi:hypothetical protein
MTMRKRLLATTFTALLCATQIGGEAQAWPGYWRGHSHRSSVGAVIAGVAVGAAIQAILAPPVVEVYGPPPPAYPPPVVMMPPPAVVVAAPRAASPAVGITLSGVLQDLGAEQGLTGGAAVDLQYRANPHAMLSLELQSLKVEHTLDRTQREDTAALVGLRLFPWDWTLSPFVDLAAGFGRASYHCCAYQEHAAQFLGRYGVGLELRLGSHVVLDAQVATVHRLRLDEPGPALSAFEDHERATEVRGGFGFVF